MPNNFSISTAGATPQNAAITKKANSLQSGILSGIGRGAASLWGDVKGLASDVGSVASKGSYQTGVNNAQTSVGQPAPYKAPTVTPGLIPAPSTPVKSVTHAAPDGSTTTTAFHAPASTATTPTTTPTPGLYSATTGLTANGLTPQQVSEGYSTISGGFDPVNGQSTSSNTQSSPNSQNNTVPTDLSTGQPYDTHTTTLQSAANAVNAARQPTADETYYNNMAVTGKELQNINTLSPYGDASMYGGTGQQLEPGLGAFDFAPERASDTGLATSIGNIFGSAAQTGETNAIAQQQQNLGGAEALLGSAAPQTQFGQLTNPYTGQPVAGGTVTNNPLLNNAVSQAAQLVANGASINDPNVQALINPYGAPGTQALTSLLQNSSGGTYNPTTQAASAGAQAQNVGIAGTSDTQTAAAGYAQTVPAYQQASTAFSTAGQQANNLISTMSSLGINSSDSQDWNTAINAAGSKLGSAKIASFKATLAEAQQAYTNLLSSVGAATPTVNGEQATSIFNPSSTPKQIAAAIDALNNAAYAKLEPQYQQAVSYYNQLHGTNVTSIPGYNPPVLPSSLTQGNPTGANTDVGNLSKEGGVAAGEGILSLGGQILNHITTLI